jgi:hypothetical protein
MDEAWPRRWHAGDRSEADVARLVIQQTEQMISMALSMGLDALLPTLERVREEARSVLSACMDRNSN